MTQSLQRSLIALRVLSCVLALLGGATHAAQTESFAVKLSSQDTDRLDQLACKDAPGGASERIEARARDRNRADVSALVGCRAHGDFKGRPMRHVGRCAKKGGEWTCGKSELEIVVPTQDRDLNVRVATLDAAKVYEVMTQLGARGWFKKDYGDSTDCDVRPGAAKELMLVECVGWEITVTSWCPLGDCPRILSSFRR